MTLYVQSLSSFDLTNEKEQFNAFNWKNTRPLLANENLSKKRNTIEEYKIHCNKIKSFLNCDIAKLRELP
jgi:hypothetical protein